MRHKHVISKEKISSKWCISFELGVAGLIFPRERPEWHLNDIQGQRRQDVHRLSRICELLTVHLASTDSEFKDSIESLAVQEAIS